MQNTSPRLFDHIALPVTSLGVARERFAALGFVVQPDAHHTFGTSNCMVNFANGGFIEPLAISDADIVDEHERAGNTFLRRDKVYRYRNGNEGFSMLVFGDASPAETKIDFEERGLDTGNLVTIERPGLRVDLAFGLDPRSPDMSSFLCQRKDGPPKFTEAQTSHQNSATRISSVTMVHEKPQDFASYISIVSGSSQVDQMDGGISISLPNCDLRILTPQVFRDLYGVKPAVCGPGLRLSAFEVEVGSLDSAEACLKESKINHEMIGTRLVVPASNGQGAPIGFVEG